MIKEPPWMNERIRKEVGKRRNLNRLKRNAITEEEEVRYHMPFSEQRKTVQTLIKDESSIHERNA